MKLNCWRIQQSLNAADWNGAVAVLAAEFGIVLPHELRIDIIRDQAYIHEIELYLIDKSYSWNEITGFFISEWTKSEQVFADIFVPQVLP